MAQLYVIIAIIVVLVGGGVVAYEATKKSTPNSPTTVSQKASTATVASACLKSYNDSQLCAFAEHTNIASQQYVAIGTATIVNGTSPTFTVSNDGKGNREVTYGYNGQEISSITLNGITYIQEGSGTTWLEYTASSTVAASAPNPTSGFDLNFNTSTPAGVSVTKVGTSACGSLTCYDYKVVDVATPTTTAYVYFDTHDYLLRHWTSSDSTTGVNVNLTFTYKSVTITKPSPVQQITT